MFREAERHELKGQAEPSEDRAQGDQASLGLSGFPLGALGVPEEVAQGGAAGQHHLRTVHGQDAPDSLPPQGGRESSFIPRAQATPQHFPEAQWQIIPGLGERLFGNGVAFPGAKGADQPPGAEEPLRHRGGVERHEHHQPGDDFGDERPFSLGRTPGLARHPLELPGWQDVPEGCQAGLLENRCSRRARGTDGLHEKASLQSREGVVIRDHVH
jgi:hypothetical protein